MNLNESLDGVGKAGFEGSSLSNTQIDNTPPKPKHHLVPKAAIYIRVSTAEQNPENQLQACQDLAQRRGYEVAIVFKEHASAWKKGNERHQFNLMLERARAGKYHHIIAWDIDRLHRNAKRFIKMIKGYQKIGVQFHTVNQEYLETLNRLPEPFDQMMLDFLMHWEGFRAQDESDRKSRRTKAAYTNRTKKWGRPKMSRYMKRRIQELREEKKSIRTIAKKLHISIGAVHKICTEYEKFREAKKHGVQKRVQK